jgi:hypothetical protein
MVGALDDVGASEGLGEGAAVSVGNGDIVGGCPSTPCWRIDPKQNNIPKQSQVILIFLSFEMILYCH